MPRLLSVVLVLTSLFGGALVATDAAAASPSDTTARRNVRAQDFPTQADAANIYNYLENGDRSGRDQRVLRLRAGDCVRPRVVARARSGRLMDYDPPTGERPRRDDPQALTLAFNRTREARSAMTRFRRIAARCAGRSSAGGTTVRLRRFPTDSVAERKAVSFRTRVTGRGRDTRLVTVISRSDNSIMMTQVRNDQKGPRRIKAQRFHDRQVETRLVRSSSR